MKLRRSREEEGWAVREARGAARRDTRWSGVVVLVGLAVLVLWGLSCYWSCEPPLPNAPEGPGSTPGLATTDALIRVASTLLDKPGGYVRNDVLPPGVMLDNMPSWEYGALLQVRAFLEVLRNEIARPQSQSPADPDLSIAEPRFNVDSESWLFPRDESAYGEGIRHLERYRTRLQGEAEPQAFFQVRAKNLALWLEIVSRRLGGLAEELQTQASPIAIEGEAVGRSSRLQARSWFQSDDLFYKARGSAWALLILARGVEQDFHDVLERKNALATFHNFENTLVATQRPLFSPMVVNGGGFGLLPSHDLVMSAYLSTANNMLQTLERLTKLD